MEDIKEEILVLISEQLASQNQTYSDGLKEIFVRRHAYYKNSSEAWGINHRKLKDLAEKFNIILD